MIRRTFLAAVVGVLCTPAAASAHAMLERASPLVGSIIHGAPTAISLRFTEAIEPSLCVLGLANAAGAAVPLGTLTVSERGQMLSAAVRAAMTPGRYQVHWRVVSVDTHVTQGAFSFTVAP